MDGMLDAQMQNALLAARGTASTSRSTAGQTPDQIRKTAEDFEAVFLSQMMEQMLGETTESSFGGGPGENAFKSMLNEEYAKVMAKAGGIGLADRTVRIDLNLDMQAVILQQNRRRLDRFALMTNEFLWLLQPCHVATFEGDLELPVLHAVADGIDMAAFG